jgi:hypothetical protein
VKQPAANAGDAAKSSEKNNSWLVKCQSSIPFEGTVK